MFTLLVFDRENRKVLSLEEIENEDEAFRRHLENAEKYDGQDEVTVELFIGGRWQSLHDFPWYSKSSRP